jgi:hypothetical protein
MNMTREEALAKARKIWGKKAHITQNDKALTEVEKAPLVEELRALQQQRRELDAKIKELQGKTLSRRRDVGYIDGVIGGFHVEGSGDTWADAFRRVEERREKDRKERETKTTGLDSVSSLMRF